MKDLTRKQMESLDSILNEDEDNFRFYANYGLFEFKQKSHIPNPKQVEIFIAGAKWV